MAAPPLHVSDVSTSVPAGVVAQANVAYPALATVPIQGFVAPATAAPLLPQSEDDALTQCLKNLVQPQIMPDLRNLQQELCGVEDMQQLSHLIASDTHTGNGITGHNCTTVMLKSIVANAKKMHVHQPGVRFRNDKVKKTYRRRELATSPAQDISVMFVDMFAAVVRNGGINKVILFKCQDQCRLV